MKTFLIILSILAFLGLVIITYMLITSKPYPKEIQEEEDEELLRKFKEYRDKKNQDY